MALESDRNFDDLAARFRRNVYDRLKGRIRLEVLQRDLLAQVPALGGASRPLRILDAGGGQAQLGIWLNQQGHNVTVCDISEEMLALAQEAAEVEGEPSRITFVHSSIQALAMENSTPFDLIICHAVLEWVAQPQSVLAALVAMLATDGCLSLSFYNENSIVMKNLLRTNFDKVLDEDYRGYRGSLTPTWPRKKEDVYLWLQDFPLTVTSETGVRCFHDFLLTPEVRDVDPEKQLALELRLSTQEPWRSLARYIHLIGFKNN